MFTSELQLLRMYTQLASQRLRDARRDARHDERGSVGDIIMIALVAVATVTVVGIIVAKMMSWAHSTPDPSTR